MFGQSHFFISIYFILRDPQVENFFAFGNLDLFIEDIIFTFSSLSLCILDFVGFIIYSGRLARDPINGLGFPRKTEYSNKESIIIPLYYIIPSRASAAIFEKPGKVRVRLFFLPSFFSILSRFHLLRLFFIARRNPARMASSSNSFLIITYTSMDI